MRMFIQNMVSHRCEMKVCAELERLEILFTYITCGEIGFENAISPDLFGQLKEALHDAGFEILDDNKGILVERLKNSVIKLIHGMDKVPKLKFSTYLSQEFNMNYHYLSELFAKNKGMTLERFIILHKVEKVKELITYGELSIKEIAYVMSYSSVSHLSKQFKSITGISPSQYKRMEVKTRINLEDL